MIHKRRFPELSAAACGHYYTCDGRQEEAQERVALKDDAAEIWVVSDGKAGHLNQSLGLAEALKRQRSDLVLREVPAVPGPGTLLRGLLGLAKDGGGPVLLLGAGHGTHSTMLRLRREHGGRAIVLMRPSLPLGLFDLCIEPRHDGGSESRRRWLSDGPLNRMLPASVRSEEGVILLGGPSPHFRWDSEALLQQLSHICKGEHRWSLSTSRRTPADILPALRQMKLPGLQLNDAAELPPGWLGAQLPQARACWVTPDSASMVFEALTAGCAVGLFHMDPRSGSKVAGAMQNLESRGLCTSFAQIDEGATLEPPAEILAEADRCALLLLERGWV